MRLELGKDLPTLKAHAKRRIDAEAETLRQRHVTPGSGQAMTYLAKEQQARACMAEESPEPSAYPLLAATVGIERHPETGEVAESVQEVAAIVLAILDQWMQAAAAIERARLSAKQAVDDATTHAEIETAADVTWPAV